MRVGVDGDPPTGNPKVVEAFALSDPFQLTFFTVTAEPLTLNVPFHS